MQTSMQVYAKKKGLVADNYIVVLVVIERSSQLFLTSKTNQGEGFE